VATASICSLALSSGVIPVLAGLRQTNVPEQSKYPEDDQVRGDNVVQHPGHDQNEDAGEKRYQGSKAQGDVHDNLLCEQKLIVTAIVPLSPGPTVRSRTHGEEYSQVKPAANCLGISYVR
jgi:hypothetical protein